MAVCTWIETDTEKKKLWTYPPLSHNVSALMKYTSSCLALVKIYIFFHIHKIFIYLYVCKKCVCVCVCVKCFRRRGLVLAIIPFFLFCFSPIFLCCVSHDVQIIIITLFLSIHTHQWNVIIMAFYIFFGCMHFSVWTHKHTHTQRI